MARFTEGYAPSVAPLSRALRRIRRLRRQRRRRALAVARVPPGPGSVGRRALACARDRGERTARETGALGQLANALNYVAAFRVHSGAFATAAVLIDELEVITQATGFPPLKYAACKAGRVER